MVAGFRLKLETMSEQTPIQRWLVLTEHGVELQPTGCRGLVDQFAKAVEPYRRRTTVVSETRYRRVRA